MTGLSSNMTLKIQKNKNNNKKKKKKYKQMQNGLTKRLSSYTIWFQMRCWMTSCLNHDYLILIFIHFPYLLYEKSIVYYRLCRDRMFFDKILVSEYKPFKRSNKANLFIALVQQPVSQIKMTFQEIRIIATGPCITNQLRDVNTIVLV
jgi:hypothetical protein